jgi:hypothetical protein
MVSAFCQGNRRGGFALLLYPDYCRYRVEFRDQFGNTLLWQEECFTCQKVPVEGDT